MLSYSHHKKEIKNLSYDGLFLYFWKQEVWGYGGMGDAYFGVHINIYCWSDCSEKFF